MKRINELASIHQTAERCRAEAIPISETALRRFVKMGDLPAVFAGNKALLYWPNILHFVKQGNGTQAENLPPDGLHSING